MSKHAKRANGKVDDPIKELLRAICRVALDDLLNSSSYRDYFTAKQFIDENPELVCWASKMPVNRLRQLTAQ